jgi:hypothetical protein
MPFGLPYPDEHLALHWLRESRDDLVRLAGPSLIPAEGTKAFGAGAWGCVWPTPTPEVAFKLTLDHREATFVAAAQALGAWPRGIVRHYAVVCTEHHLYRRNVFALWRERAEVATFSPDRWPGVVVADARRFAETLKACSHCSLVAMASVERGVTKPGPVDHKALAAILARPETTSFGTAKLFERYRGPKRLALALAAMRHYAERGIGEGFAPDVFRALLWYLDRGLVLADVHDQNVGLVRRDGGPLEAVILDPGHAVVLDGGPDYAWPKMLSKATWSAWAMLPFAP